MKPARQRTRESSTQNYRRFKLTQQFTYKKTVMEKLRDVESEDGHKSMTSLTKPALNLSSTSWCLYDENISEMIGFREGQQREVASLTKIMTTILSLNLIKKYSLDRCKKLSILEIAVRISRSASMLNGTTANLRYGKWLRLEDLLYGAMLPSGNDAAYLLAEVLGLLLFYERMKPEDKEYIDIESIDITLYDNTVPFVNRFLKEMNKLGRELKLMKTTFSNPHGLSNVLNISTAKDMIELSRYACTNKDFVSIMNTEEYECDFFNDDFETIAQTKVWKNTNKLLKKGWEGVKTGHTPSAGCCLSSYREGIFIVILNCSNLETRFTETEQVYEWYQNSKTRN